MEQITFPVRVFKVLGVQTMLGNAQRTLDYMPGAGVG